MAGPQMRGPGGRRGMRGGKRSKNPKKTLGRLMKYIQKGYGVQFVVVLICILLSAVANVAGSMFLKSLIDDYISPLLLQAAPVFTGLLHALISMAVIYLIGIATTFVYNWLMVSISQGVLKKVRDEMFAHMQKLPIRYFDTHTHGDLMSHFTNDTDTLQQMLSQSVPQMFSSAMTIISVFIGMLVTNVWLTLFVLLGVCVMLKVVKKLGGQSAKYFLEQQKSLGRVNGYIEEMINGQKVIKVFCHEEKCKEQFDALNDELRENAASANTFANILMPIMMNIGNLLYVLVAVVWKRCLAWKNRTWHVLLVLTALLNLACGLLKNSGVFPGAAVSLLDRSFLPYLVWFFAGLYLWHFKETILQKLTGKWFILLIVFICYKVCWQTFGWKLPGYYADLVTSLLLPVVVLACAYGWKKHRLKNDSSYGIFLYHWPLINLVFYWNLPKKMHHIPLFLLYVAGFLALACASWFLLERHVLKRKR